MAGSRVWVSGKEITSLRDTRKVVVKRKKRKTRTNPLAGRNILTQQQIAYPRSKRVLLKYATQMTFTTTGAGLPAYNRFNANSLFDPDRTGVGGQAHFYDQLTPMYASYRVDNLKYRITFSGGDRDYYCMVNTAPNASLLPSGVSAAYMLEQRGSKWALAKSSGPKCVIQGTVNLPKLFGLSKSEYEADDNNFALIGANPVNVAVLVPSTQAVDAAATNASYVMIELWYDALMFNPISVGAS